MTSNYRFSVGFPGRELWSNAVCEGTVFAGESGTYLVEASISRTIVTGVNEPKLTDLIEVYPNPSSNYILVDLQRFDGRVSAISMMNMQGQQVLSADHQTTEELKVPVNNLNDGLYVLQIQTDKGLKTKKIIIRK